MNDRFQDPTSCLEAVLAEMVWCALAWEEQQEKGDRCIQRKGFTGTAPPTQCPSPDEISRQEWPESEEEDGRFDPYNAA